MSLYYHLSRRPLREGTALTPGVFGERVSSVEFRREHYALYIRERLFEDIRQRFYPQAPSRLQSVFLYPDLALARCLHGYVHHYHGYLYEVEVLDGQAFVVDMDLLNCEGESLELIQDRAKRYWAQEQHPDSASLELLANGATLVRRLIAGPSSFS